MKSCQTVSNQMLFKKTIIVGIFVTCCLFTFFCLITNFCCGQNVRRFAWRQTVAKNYYYFFYVFFTRHSPINKLTLTFIAKPILLNIRKNNFSFVCIRQSNFNAIFNKKEMFYCYLNSILNRRLLWKVILMMMLLKFFIQ